MVKEGTCHQRACVKDNTLTVRYLHPADTGKYTCVAKNKFGKDQRKVVLNVKVSKQTNKQKLFLTLQLLFLLFHFHRAERKSIVDSKTDSIVLILRIL